ncbi:phosphoadenosine phosphosulfate reductase family protein [Vibrio sp. Isolate23]|uniref:phosphoadenosine phosphosulfate reductase domain-containing protein n=1 Tax=Vibrio sp. Isolate23 TaxID=2908533 RepID=UPI001EFEEEA7|nr:phosphoadenosine phosphosulfate reductase family protein [Vibrio sp. Isolate23]MCG9685116.1 phosphoadenosine phosphosulfate reductase family protein [Vibrio sp. Isolate23]
MKMSFDSHQFDDQFIVPHLRNIASNGDVVSDPKKYFSAPVVDLDFYDRIVICMSGGKDSIACLLCLLDMGVEKSKIELWHHDIDGREGSDLMDWSFMASYNQKLADAFGLPLYFSWLDGGFEGEMLKNNSFSRPHKIETPNGLVTLERDKKRGKPGTRLKFPQVSASLQTRWCSSALKIDVGRRALNNQDRFNNSKVLFVTGERRQESSNRAKYNQFEPHACDRRSGKKSRLVDAWRPVLHWDEEMVWDALSRHGVIAPVPYRLGWSRSSCMTCIYNGPRIWATINEYFPDRTQRIAEYERQFGITISRKRIDVIDLGSSVKPFEIEDLEALEQAVKRDYDLDVILKPGDKWIMPVGAFGCEGCGAV